MIFLFKHQMFIKNFLYVLKIVVVLVFRNKYSLKHNKICVISELRDSFRESSSSNKRSIRRHFNLTLKNTTIYILDFVPLDFQEKV